MPTDFIPIAERGQLILDIGYWTIEEACKQIIKWKKDAENPFFIAVNLSVIQIRDRDFLRRVTQLIQGYKIPHGYLEFEMTESILLNESQRAIEIIKQLKLLGIKLSIDDFGTGYSSFDYIRKLPLDKIKIDKSFIKDVPYDTSSTAIPALSIDSLVLRRRCLYSALVKSIVLCSRRAFVRIACRYWYFFEFCSVLFGPLDIFEDRVQDFPGPFAAHLQILLS